ARRLLVQEHGLGKEVAPPIQIAGSSTDLDGPATGTVPLKPQWTPPGRFQSDPAGSGATPVNEARPHATRA
ncbi:MAG TPA: hypothetical protein PLB26_18170, partial [Rubrivivax sp.]|nr:hypothetical protein [Rubrivivax sp.]